MANVKQTNWDLTVFEPESGVTASFRKDDEMGRRLAFLDFQCDGEILDWEATDADFSVGGRWVRFPNGTHVDF